MPKMNSRIIITLDFLEEIVSNAAFLYPNENTGALKGEVVELKSDSGKKSYDLLIERIIPFEEVKRTKISARPLSSQEVISKIKPLNRKNLFLGTYHSHTYPGKKLPENDDLTTEPDKHGDSDLESIKEIWQDLANYEYYNPIDFYLELLVSIKQTQSKKPKEHKLYYENFPYLEYFTHDHKGFKARVHCFNITADEQLQEVKRTRRMSFLAS